MTSAEVKTVEEARAVLGLEADATAEAIRAAFHCAVKTAHPDRGGDPAHFRQVLEAYRLLIALADAKTAPRAAHSARSTRAAAEPPAPEPPVEPQPESHAERPRPEPRVVRISVAEAFAGANKSIRLAGGRRGRIKLPPGLRSGDIVRFGPDGEGRLVVSITPEPNLEVRGDDLWMTVPVGRTFLKEGGRLEVVTPRGPRAVWISRTSAARGLFRTPGEGLPGNEAHARGHLYLRLTLDKALSDSPAKSLLRRFAAAWAA
jgi:curved DNA-binding protein